MPAPSELPDLLAAARGDAPCDLVAAQRAAGERRIRRDPGDRHRDRRPVRRRPRRGLRTRARTVDLEGRVSSPRASSTRTSTSRARWCRRRSSPAPSVPRGVTAGGHRPARDRQRLRARRASASCSRTRGGRALAMFVNASSCVPATPTGAPRARGSSAKDLAPLLAEPEVLGLAEVMNFPGVGARRPGVLGQARAPSAGRPDRRPLPGRSRATRSTRTSRPASSSDHECTRLEEAREKLRLGLTIFLREATNARNLAALLPARHPPSPSGGSASAPTTAAGGPARGGLDRPPGADARSRAGVDPVVAIRMATLNPAEHFGIADRGIVAPGRQRGPGGLPRPRAPRAEQVSAAGRLVAQDGRLLGAARARRAPPCTDTVTRSTGATGHLRDPAPRGRRVRVIGVDPRPARHRAA